MRFSPLFFLLLAPVLTTAAPLSQSAYVWQRAHTPAVSRALEAHARSFDTLMVLAAEVSWQKTNGLVTAQITRVAPDWPALRAAPRIGLVLRINAYSESFRHDDEAILSLTALARELLATAKAQGATVSEFQIDYDATTATLPGYRLWLDTLRAAVAPVPLTFTALPTWLTSPHFALLAHMADGFVLQVHSLERPHAADSPFTLCDPSAARLAISRAATLGVPFQVALPTYGYTLAFDATGKFASLVAEGPTPAWPASFVRRDVRADPATLADLVRTLTAKPPANLTGLLWYRLPVAGDQRNWSWPTLAAVMAGHTPAARPQAVVVSTALGLHDLVLINDGDDDFSGPVNLTVRWPADRPLAADALAGFALSASGPTTLYLSSQACRLPPGTRLAVGWLRLPSSSLPPHVILEN